MILALEIGLIDPLSPQVKKSGSSFMPARRKIQFKLNFGNPTIQLEGEC